MRNAAERSCWTLPDHPPEATADAAAAQLLEQGRHVRAFERELIFRAATLRVAATWSTESQPWW